MGKRGGCFWSDDLYVVVQSLANHGPDVNKETSRGGSEGHWRTQTESTVSWPGRCVSQAQPPVLAGHKHIHGRKATPGSAEWKPRWSEASQQRFSLWPRWFEMLQVLAVYRVYIFACTCIAYSFLLFDCGHVDVNWFHGLSLNYVKIPKSDGWAQIQISCTGFPTISSAVCCMPCWHPQAALSAVFQAASQEGGASKPLGWVMGQWVSRSRKFCLYNHVSKLLYVKIQELDFI